MDKKIKSLLKVAKKIHKSDDTPAQTMRGRSFGIIFGRERVFYIV